MKPIQRDTVPLLCHRETVNQKKRARLGNHHEDESCASCGRRQMHPVHGSSVWVFRFIVTLLMSQMQGGQNTTGLRSVTAALETRLRQYFFADSNGAPRKTGFSLSIRNKRTML